MHEVAHYSPARRWLVVVLSGLIQVLTIGAILSLTVFLEPMKESLSVDYGEISLICSLSAALCQGLGSVATLILSLTGYRLGIVLGGLGMTASLLAAAFTPSYTGVVILMGPVYGFACSIPSAASTIIPGFLIGESHRHIAYSIVFTGAGIGMMIFPPLYQFLIQEYHWRGAVIVLAGISLNICAFGMLFPSKPGGEGGGSSNDDDKRTLEENDNEPAQKLNTTEKRSSDQNPPTVDVNNSDKTDRNSRSCPPKFLNLNLWCQPRFWALWLATFCLQFAGVGIGAFFFNILLETFGVNGQTASFILTILGVSSIAGRLFVMLLQRSPYMPRWCTFSLVCCLFGSCLVLLGSGFSGQMEAIALYSVAGFLVGIIFPLHSIILTDLFPVAMLPSTYGYTYLALGIGSLTGPPLAGRLRDYSGTYQLSTAVLGGLLALIHVPVLLALPFILCRHRRNYNDAARLRHNQQGDGESGDTVLLDPVGGVKTPKIVVTDTEETKELDASCSENANGLPIVQVRRRADWR